MKLNLTPFWSKLFIARPGVLDVLGFVRQPGFLEQLHHLPQRSRAHVSQLLATASANIRGELFQKGGP